MIHSTAIVETQKLGKHCNIWAFVHILPGAEVGDNVNICDHCFIENQVKIGNNVTIKCGVYIWDGITIEDNVMIGPAVVFTNDKYPRSKNKDWKMDSILVMNGSSIGANATILPNLTIGRYALVAAGSVVTKNVPDYTLVMGNPAKKIKNICECTIELSFNEDIAECICGKTYSRKQSGIVRVS